MTDHIQITFTQLQPEQKDILIAQLSDAGFEGFEEGETTLDAFIPENHFEENLLQEIVYKYQLHFKKTKIAATNWNQLWESSFQPVVVENFCAIRADFHQPITGVAHEIVITPKMSFGTGHHSTTFMMIEMMREIDFAGKSVFDFGTGTGILAILGEKLGAKKILAIDNDDWSVENAKENICQNGCTKAEIKKSSSIPAGKKFDIILANINKNVILDNLPSLADQLLPGGFLVLSGLLQEDKEEIVKATAARKLDFQKELSRNNWICLGFTL